MTSSPGPLAASLIYKAACVYALTCMTEPSDADHAMKLFRQAAKQGYLDTAGKYAEDQDLDKFQARPEFQELVRSIQSINKKDK